MVSPELLRRYPFFSELSDGQLKAIAMISEEVTIPANTELFVEGQPADYLYLLINGSIDLCFVSEEKYHPETRKVFPVGEINPGEVFGISAILAPFVYSANQCTRQPSKVIKMDAAGLRALMDENSHAGYVLMKQISKALMERLTYTRIELAAAV